jgi:uncharacterized protein
MEGGGVREIRRLVVSIHDVAPQTWPQVRRIVDELAAQGVDRTSLLVVPYYHGQTKLERGSDLADWLRRTEEAGHEMVLHGWEHLGVGRPTTYRDAVKERWSTQGEGEFLSLDYPEARNRIERGLELFGQLGLHAYGFVAPSWLASKDTLLAASDLRLEYTNSYSTVSDLQRGTSRFVPSLVFGPGNLNEDVSIAAQSILAKLLRFRSTVRVVLHPPCIEHGRRWTRILSMIKVLIAGKQAATYHELLLAFRRDAGSVATYNEGSMPSRGQR